MLNRIKIVAAKSYGSKEDKRISRVKIVLPWVVISLIVVRLYLP